MRVAAPLAGPLIFLAAIVEPGTLTQAQVSWARVSGWQVSQDHAGSPDVLLIGVYGEPAWRLAPFAPPARSPNPARQAVPSPYMPLLVLRCENGVTELIVQRSPLESGPGRSRSPRGREDRTPTAEWGKGKLLLDLGDGDPIEVDLPGNVHRGEPVLLPDPFDNIGRLRRHQYLHYFELDVGQGVSFGLGGAVGAITPDAVFPLEGLDAVLRGTRDPCAWRSSD